MSFRTFVAIIAGLVVGLWIADVDQIFPFLRPPPHHHPQGGQKGAGNGSVRWHNGQVGSA
jgi:hypothetical protein